MKIGKERVREGGGRGGRGRAYRGGGRERVRGGREGGEIVYLHLSQTLKLNWLKR